MDFSKIELAAKELHQKLKVQENEARCFVTPHGSGVRIVVQRMSDGLTTSTFLKEGK